MSKYERGKGNLDFCEFIEVAADLEIDVGDILGLSVSSQTRKPQPIDKTRYKTTIYCAILNPMRAGDTAMDKVRIEKEVRGLQLEIYNNAKSIFPTGVPPLTRLFDPDVAAHVCGYEYEIRERLEGSTHGSQRYETAGIIDNLRQTILISNRFPYETQRFTGAHEIGHLVLHPGLRLHRDRPVSGGHSSQRIQVESEADYFAACFLAPRKLVRTEFERRFGPTPIALTHEIAFHLGGDRMNEILNARTGSLDFAVALAGATRYNGRRFDSMAHAFGMSIHAMAIRLDELGLVIY